MKKVLAIVMCLAMVLVCLAACQSGAPANTPDSNTGTSNPSSQQGSSQQDDKPAYYKIAYIGPFTGNSAQYGETHKRALDFAINEINEAGGVDGVPFKIEYFDDKTTPKKP